MLRPRKSLRLYDGSMFQKLVLPLLPLHRHRAVRHFPHPESLCPRAVATSQNTFLIPHSTALLYSVISVPVPFHVTRRCLCPHAVFSELLQARSFVLGYCKSWKNRISMRIVTNGVTQSQESLLLAG